MPTNLEIETKSMLEKGEYKALISAYKNTKSYTQNNYYISSDEMLSKVEKYGLRIRRKNSSFELTLKVIEKIGTTEINQKIQRKSLQKLKYFRIFPDGEVKNYLEENKICDISKLQIIGCLKTTRKDINFQDSLISVDKSKYNGKTDFEIECESEDILTAEKDLKEFLKINEIKYKKSEHNKLARFLMTLH